MNTSTLVTLIQKETGSHLSRAEILEIMNIVQNEIYSHDSNWTRIKPDPLITTTDGTYLYTASSALKNSTGGSIGSAEYDVRRVEEVYSYRNPLEPFLYNFGQEVNTFRPDIIGMGERNYKTINRVTCTDSVQANSSDCQIRFWEDNNPGTTGVSDIVFRAVAYKWPTQLTAESIALGIPDGWDMNLLRPGVLRYLDQRVYGRDIDYGPIFDRNLKKFISWSGRTARSDIPPTTPLKDF